MQHTRGSAGNYCNAVEVSLRAHFEKKEWRNSVRQRFNNSQESPGDKDSVVGVEMRCRLVLGIEERE